jgi:tetratricopeptide (TPR) repeat protein
MVNEAIQNYKSGETENAISILQKVLLLEVTDQYKSLIYNNIGYYEQRVNKYAESIPNFLKSLELNPGYGYANDNLGLSYLMIGELEKGKEYLDKAIETGENDIAYSYRNLAIYYMLKNENELAETNFQKSFSENKPVDLLNYFYAKFQLMLGNKEKAIEILQISLKKGEKEASKMMDELSNK